MQVRLLRGLLLFAVMAAMALPATAQTPNNSRFRAGGRMPLAPVPPTGEPVAPFFEGWFRNSDGSYTFSFGFFNLSTDQAHDIPFGPDNFIEPAEFDGVQPTHFPANPRRDRGVFHITVPASWEETQERITWTLVANGKPAEVKARVGYGALQLGYEPRAMGSVPPEVRVEEDGEVGVGIPGIWSEPRRAVVGDPMLLAVWGDEVSERMPEDVVNLDIPLTVSWLKHQGPAGDVTFAPRRISIETGSGPATTNVTFSAPGEYVLRARVDNWTANDSSGGDQCCWTNAFVPVTVTAN